MAPDASSAFEERVPAEQAAMPLAVVTAVATPLPSAGRQGSPLLQEEGQVSTHLFNVELPSARMPLYSSCHVNARQWELSLCPANAMRVLRLCRCGRRCFAWPCCAKVETASDRRRDMCCQQQPRGDQFMRPACDHSAACSALCRASRACSCCHRCTHRFAGHHRKSD